MAYYLGKRIRTAARLSNYTTHMLSEKISFFGTTTPPVPVEVRLQKNEKILEVKYSDGRRFCFSSEFLRVSAPDAPSTSSRRGIVSGRRFVGIMGVEPVGAYALRIEYDDLHRAGELGMRSPPTFSPSPRPLSLPPAAIYPYEYLYELGTHKYTRSKEYIRLLRQSGLSRDPLGWRPKRSVP